MTTRDRRLKEFPLPADVTGDILSPDNIRVTRDAIEHIRQGRERVVRTIRRALIEHNAIRQIPDRRSRLRVVEAIDGSYALHRAVSFILLAFGGATYCPDNPNINEKIRYNVHIVPIFFSENVGRVSQGLMTLSEFYLATTSRNVDLIIMDGSFISFLTRLNSFFALFRSPDQQPYWRYIYPFIDRSNPNSYFNRAGADFINKVFMANILSNSPRIIAIPKATYTSILTDWIIRNFNIPKNIVNNLQQYFTDRTLFSLLLRVGEYIYHNFGCDYIKNPQNPQPTNFARRTADPYKPDRPEELEDFLDRRNRFSQNGGITIVYFRPHTWAPAYKIEIPGNVNERVIEDILIKVAELIVDPSIVEPYPQYVVDKIIRQIAKTSRAVLAAVEAQLNMRDPATVRLLLSAIRTSIFKGKRYF